MTCIHNVFSQQRYLEHYGEVTIQNLKSNVCTCKITFVKVKENNFLPFVVLVDFCEWYACVWFSSTFFRILLTDKGFILFYCSLDTGVQIRTRMRCRAWCWTKVGVSFTGLEVCGMKASSVTLCRLRNVSGSQVSTRSSKTRLFTYLKVCPSSIHLTFLTPLCHVL